MQPDSAGPRRNVLQGFIRTLPLPTPYCDRAVTDNPQELKMTLISKALIRASLVTLAFTAVDAPARAAARASFDGNWSVVIVTNSGACERAYRFGLSIQNGGVSYNGSLPVNVDGRVSGNGSVRVRVSAGSQSASGAGRLSRDQGRGQWRGIGSSGSCAGTWTAQRQWIGASY